MSDTPNPVPSDPKRDQALLDFCGELVALLFYQPDIPMQHKKDLGAKFQALHDAFSTEARP